MVTKIDLQDWVIDAIKAEDGSATLVEVAKHVWKNHEKELRHSGNLYFTWQYDMRWAATALRKAKKIKSAQTSPRGVWELPRAA
ncbi:MAG: hypothetical protein IH994_10410 [Proteobacteria bacterium]|nr:hypothetical protein [Pseudomonadota bacterium]